MFAPARKGDVVVVHQIHSYVMQKNFKKKEYNTFFLAKVVRANREGKVIKYIRPHWGVAQDVRHEGVMVINDPSHQKAAQRLFETEAGAMDYDDVKSVRLAILSMEN